MNESNKHQKIPPKVISCMLAGIISFFSLPVISWIPLISGVIAIVLFLSIYKNCNKTIEKTMINYGLILGATGVILFWITPFILQVLWK